MGKRYICLDIGGTKILGAVFDEEDNIVYRVKEKTRTEKGTGQVEQTIITVVEKLIQESGISKSDVAGISAGVPGVIDEDTGVIIFTPNLPMRNYDIRSVIERKFNIPFYIGNDVNVGVLGEWKYGAATGRKNVIGLFVGTGIGGGIIINNALYTGSTHAAAEMGHMVLNTEGPYCNCGQRGCLEAYASKVAMTREIKNQIERGRKTELQEAVKGNILKSKALKKAVEEKDEIAVEVVDRAMYYLAAGAGSLINIFNPDMLVLGGGVFESLGNYLTPIFKKYIKRFAWPQMLETTEIVQSKLGDDAGIYGALAMIKSGK